MFLRKGMWLWLIASGDVWCTSTWRCVVVGLHVSGIVWWCMHIKVYGWFRWCVMYIYMKVVMGVHISVNVWWCMHIKVYGCFKCVMLNLQKCVSFDLFQVICGQNCTFLVQANGSLLACGEGSYGRLGQGNSDDVHAPTIITSLQGKQLFLSPVYKINSSFLWLV